ncbi:MAG: NADH-quinone oxidoreductase subunit N [Chloroflexi bacterium]|nr:NADH-quinone oxidoreductase subunit N [Chloroflexota bacterium]
MENLTANLYLLWPEFLLAGLAFVVLTADFFLPAERKNYLALVSILGLAALIIFTTAFLLNRNAALYGGLILIDRFSLLFKVTFLGLGILMVWSSADFVKRYLSHPGEYYAMVLFSILGMVVMASAGELLTAYIGLELLSFSLYVLVSHAREDLKSNEAGTKYILLGAFASALLLYGISMVYGVVVQVGIPAPTTFEAIATYVARVNSLPVSFLVGMALIIAGLGFKVAAVPFHMWTPDVYEGAPLPVTAYLAVGSKVAAFALILRLFAQAFLPAIEEWQTIIAILAAATMVLGNLVALAQRNIKRLLAYSSIGQVGYLLMGIAALSASASNALILHLVGYGVTNLAAFVAVIAFYNATGKDEVADFAGLADRNPFIAMALTVSLFSLAGLPIFAGFITKFYLFLAAAQADMLWLTGIAVFASLISLYYYLIVIRQMYVEEAQVKTPLSLSWVTGGLLGLLTLGTVLIGVYPKPLVDVIQTATKAILP